MRCLQFCIYETPGPWSCRDLTDETYIFEPYCKSVRLPPPLCRTPAHQLRTRRGRGRLYYYRVPGKGRLCILPHYSAAASLILLLHHSGAKHKIPTGFFVPMKKSATLINGTIFDYFTMLCIVPVLGASQGVCTLLPTNLDQQAEAAVVGSGSAAPFDAILGFGKPQK